jgi:signal transduction histidine kinase
MLTTLELILFTALCFAMKPLFKDTFMQWLYSYITLENASMFVVVLSYYLSRPFPHPMYANTAVRFVLLTGIILLFRYVIRPLYRQVVNHWNIFFYVSLCIFIYFVYYIVILGDVITVLNEQKVPLLLLCLLSVAVYASMFHSLKRISNEYALENENIKMKANQNLLQISTQSLNERMKLMDNYVEELSIQKHDARHFNATILELIENDNKEKAVEYLKSSLNYSKEKPKRYCENSAVNAVLSYYITFAQQNGITCETKLNIPENPEVDSLELSMVMANLLENAINATVKSAQSKINITAVSTGQQLIEIINPYSGEIVFDENNHPISNEQNHGIGTKSVLAFCEKNGAQIIYYANNNTFKVRLIL